MIIDPFEKENLLTAVETLRSFIEHLEVRKTCASCMYYKENEAACGKFNQVIPEHIIKVGCPEWEFDMIPF